MSSPKQAAQPSRGRPSQNTPGSAVEAPADLPPLKPRPVLFVVLGIVLALWLAALVVMRLTTVNRPLQPAPATVPTAPR